MCLRATTGQGKSRFWPGAAGPPDFAAAGPAHGPVYLAPSQTSPGQTMCATMIECAVRPISEVDPSERRKLDSDCLTVSVVQMSGHAHEIEVDLSFRTGQSIPVSVLKQHIAEMVTEKKLLHSELDPEFHPMKHHCSPWRIAISRESADGDVGLFAWDSSVAIERMRRASPSDMESKGQEPLQFIIMSLDSTFALTSDAYEAELAVLVDAGDYTGAAQLEYHQQVAVLLDARDYVGALQLHDQQRESLGEWHPPQCRAGACHR